MTAVISADGGYRYRLDRNLVQGLAAGDVVADRRVLFVMLNPSTADAERDDATIRRCMGFAERLWDATRLVVVNLYALRSTDPDELLRHRAPTGDLNDRTIGLAAAESQLLVAAWGDHPAALLPNPTRPGNATREQRVYDILRSASGRPVYCLGYCKSGAPKHPVRLPYDGVILRPWSPR